MDGSVNYFLLEETITLAQLQKEINRFIAIYGEDYPIRVNTTYDQGMDGMAITSITEDEGYIGINS